jgi:hypothetical protein
MKSELTSMTVVLTEQELDLVSGGQGEVPDDPQWIPPPGTSATSGGSTHYSDDPQWIPPPGT